MDPELSDLKCPEVEHPENRKKTEVNINLDFIFRTLVCRKESTQDINPFR